MVSTASTTPDVELPILEEIAQRVLWLSTRIVDAANRERENADGVKVGGHQASSASLVTAMTAPPIGRIAVWTASHKVSNHGTLSAMNSTVVVSPQRSVSPLWLIMAYGVLSLGELMLSPMGLSLVSSLQTQTQPR